RRTPGRLRQAVAAVLRWPILPAGSAFAIGRAERAKASGILRGPFGASARPPDRGGEWCERHVATEPAHERAARLVHQEPQPIHGLETQRTGSLHPRRERIAIAEIYHQGSAGKRVESHRRVAARERRAVD